MAADAATFVYVGNADSQDVTVLRLNADERLMPVETVVVPGGDKPGGSLPLAVSPDRKFLFVALRNEPYTLVTFAIDAATGKLTRIGSGPLADSMCYVTTDRTGRFLLAASYGGSKVTVNRIGPDGVVGGVQQTVATLPNAHAIIADPSNRFVLHTSLGGDVIYQQKFDAATGMLSPNEPPTVSVAVKGGPRHLAFAPDAAFVYVLDELSGAIHVFPWDAQSGTMQPEMQGATALPKGFEGTASQVKPWGADIHLTPDGRFLYASERTTSTLAAFRVDRKTGALTAIASYPTEQQPRGFAIDASGRYLLAAGQLSNSLTVHAIDQQTGALAALKSYPVGKNPNWVEIVALA